MHNFKTFSELTADLGEDGAGGRLTGVGVGLG